MQTIKSYLSLVKFSHTIFALPFAAIGFIIGIHSSPEWVVNYKLLIWIFVCMVTARNAAMAFNRWADRDIDALNPRTQMREIPAGIISANKAIFFVLVNSMLFVWSASQINFVCFILSPLALAIVLGYSFTKRYFWLCHLFLGLGLALAPLGAFLAVRGSLELLPSMYALAVVSWVAGFDIIYALQDVEFDVSHHLKSIPAKFGIRTSLWISSALHFICGVCILSATYLLHRDYGLNDGIYFGSAAFIILLISQHIIVGKGDLSKINLAFFSTNGLASICLAVGIIIDFYF
ncbi:MAG: UbiA family prenyltransferase [Saprospiraceae bacterium]|nr:UbiA family prenyltransferase [Saprospiraceae bacterium]